jgi:hypothetical protein
LGADRPLLTGDLGDKFQELYLPTGETLDAHSPIFVRARAGKPDFFEVTFLRSDPLGVHDGKALGFSARIVPVGEDTVLKAASDDFAASYVIGRNLLWRLDDPVAARPYLERAAAGGIADALFDLAIVALFSRVLGGLPKPVLTVIARLSRSAVGAAHGSRDLPAADRRHAGVASTNHPVDARELRVHHLPPLED